MWNTAALPMHWQLLPCGGDSPDCILALDILAPGEQEFTEIRIMPMEQFRQFIMSENIGYQLDGTIAK